MTIQISYLILFKFRFLDPGTQKAVTCENPETLLFVLWCTVPAKECQLYVVLDRFYKCVICKKQLLKQINCHNERLQYGTNMPVTRGSSHWWYKTFATSLVMHIYSQSSCNCMNCAQMCTTQQQLMWLVCVVHKAEGGRFCGWVDLNQSQSREMTGGCRIFLYITCSSTLCQKYLMAREMEVLVIMRDAVRFPTSLVCCTENTK